ncbi:uncharacterized protein RCC_02247 [Ramularia collo-cygni]|uniref:Uncharacterized protein n=1 Tax=Ramularia collo-cygni TaxID=112498 RepID=A0A2D3V1R7_9PEZI|nr:uncharacterized protein RCC_02247 [Ramularia collo-cygni]CZT16404.1 uncharacterized protein RCC_02247 [Ramularia collo-cygni]
MSTSNLLGRHTTLTIQPNRRTRTAPTGFGGLAHPAKSRRMRTIDDFEPPSDEGSGEAQIHSSALNRSIYEEISLACAKPESMS